jgi:hypothetical protein
MDEASTLSPYDILRWELQELRRWAGNPTYRAMGTMWGPQPPVHIFSVGAIADNLNGHRRSMSWDFVRFFVFSCWVQADRKDLQLRAQDRSLQRWHSLWMAQAEPGLSEPGLSGTRPGLPVTASLPVTVSTPPRQVAAVGHRPQVAAGPRRPHTAAGSRPGDVRQGRSRLRPPAAGPARLVDDGAQTSRDSRSLGVVCSSSTPPASGTSALSPRETARAEVDVSTWWSVVLPVCAHLIDTDPVLRARVRAATATRHGRRPSVHAAGRRDRPWPPRPQISRRDGRS